MPYIKGFLIEAPEGPVDPGWGQGTPRPPHVGGGPIIEPPVDPEYGRPTLPPSVGGGPIVPPVVVMPPIALPPPTVGGGPMPPPGAIWPPVGGKPPHRPPTVGGGPVVPPGQPPTVGGGPSTPPPSVGGGPTGTKYLAMVIVATDGGVVRTAWTIIDTSLEWEPPPVAGQPLPPTPEPRRG